MNIKGLIERRNAIVDEMHAIVPQEERALTEEETSKFDELEKELRALDETLARLEKLEGEKVKEVREAMAPQESPAVAEERAFVDYVLGRTNEIRDGEQNMDATNGGAVIPVSIANRIITAVKDRCPILAGATVYAVKGTLKVPVYGPKTVSSTAHDIAVGYQTEFTDITADSGAFTTKDLGGYLAGALTLIGRSVENNGAFSVTTFIVDQMAEKIAIFLEGELLKGSGHSNNHAEGALATSNTVTTAAANKITFDELLDLQASVKQAYQQNACWTMAPATFNEIRKIKDGNGVYLMQRDASSAFPYTLLGKPVYVSDNMPAIAASAKVVLYGDYSGLSVNIRENISVEVLKEKYATMHALGVVAWVEFDSVVTDAQKLACLVMHS